MEWTSKHIAEICEGSLIRGASDVRRIVHFSTDSRKIRNASSSIFVALKTAVRDGHVFISDAYKNGVRCFLVSDKNEGQHVLPDADIILVADTLDAMQRIAAHHRLQFEIPILGITGSNGKTIVKEWLGELISNKERVVKNPKSYNSQLGVPLSLSRISARHSFGIFEAGISEPNEMNRLEKMIQPTLGLFTMIGEAHATHFENQIDKVREKLQLFVRSSKLFYCSDHELIHNEIKSFLKPQNADITLVSWGYATRATLQIETITKCETESVIKATYAEEDLELVIPYTDSAYIENAIHCWLVLLDIGYEHVEISPWFMKLPPVQMRLELLKGIGGCTLINDTYSSDLASLEIALDFLNEQRQHKKKTLIISDMDQDNTDRAVYKSILKLLHSQSLYRLIFIGPELAEHINTFKNISAMEIETFNTVQDFLDEVSVQQFMDEAILVKGARRFNLERIINRLEQNIHRTVLNINLSALIHNVNTFKKRLKPSTKIMAMVKAFSYGSGSYEIAQTLESHGADYLAVAYVDEGILLRKKGIQLPILVLNPELSSLDAMLHYDLEPEIYSIGMLRQFESKLNTTAPQLKIHIKLDTGMHRLGVEEKDLESFLEELLLADCFDIKSVFSHLVASSNAAHADFTSMQKSLFEKMSGRIEEAIGYPITKHLSNSGGVNGTMDLQFDMVRLGIGLYGITDNEELPLRQISTLKTQVSQLKYVANNDTVGYNRAGVLDRDTIIATLNIGYADGYARAFGNGIGKVWIRGMKAPVVGNVCMDMLMVDVTDIPNVKEGDEVVVFGEQLPVTQLAQWIRTIPYEIIAGVSQRVKRVFYKE